ncbi:putative mitochondrial translation optimization protein [Plectosphaerella cucumerina]|uniref:Altered inheritance of mitochondria protein 32 n=1 Tax=Plectosphaerella cucumerina TaxID=40658 RepID=A0A8K0TEE3_9PEZI|nr:putative mitochondrial translation optimization protein [Plectosphaerella cucumerina]
MLPRPAFQVLRQAMVSRRTFASSPRPPPFPTVPTCPAPTCSCADTPPPLEGLDIDQTGKLNGVMSPYAEQVLICTGRDDWPSRIEDDDSGDNLAADLKELFGRGGEFRDPFHNVSILNASFPSSIPRQRAELQTTSVYLLPSFKYVPFLPRVSFDSVRVLAAGFLLPEKLHPMHDGLSPIHRDRLTRKPGLQGLLYGVRDVEDVVVLICGHGGRDARCGQYGPLLRGEFERLLPSFGVQVRTEAVEADADVPGPEALEDGRQGERQQVLAPGSVSARVGLISHIGGHKFAGNVIVYIPPNMRLEDGGEHPLAGRGIWLGRVEPRHVEGIITETILKGTVIEDMFRGGIDRDRSVLRM